MRASPSNLVPCYRHFKRNKPYVVEAGKKIEQRELVAGGRKNLSGTDFHASPEGVRRMDAPNNLTARQFN